MTDELQQNPLTESPKDNSDQEATPTPKESTKIIARLTKTDKVVLAAYVLVALSVLTIAGLVVFKIYTPTTKTQTQIQAHENPVKFIENHIQQLIGEGYETERFLAGNLVGPELDMVTAVENVEVLLSTEYLPLFKDRESGYYFFADLGTNQDVFGTKIGIDASSSSIYHAYRPEEEKEFVHNGFMIGLFELDEEDWVSVRLTRRIHTRTLMGYIDQLLLDNGFKLYTIDGYTEPLGDRLKNNPIDENTRVMVRYASDNFYCDLNEGLPEYSSREANLVFGCVTKNQVTTAIENTKELYNVIVAREKQRLFDEDNDSYDGIIYSYDGPYDNDLYGYEILTLSMTSVDDDDWGVPTTRGGYTIWLYRKQASEYWVFGFAGGHSIKHCATFSDTDWYNTLNDDGLRAFYEFECLDDYADGLTVYDRATTIGEYYGLTPNSE